MIDWKAVQLGDRKTAQEQMRSKVIARLAVVLGCELIPVAYHEAVRDIMQHQLQQKSQHPSQERGGSGLPYCAGRSCYCSKKSRGEAQFEDGWVKASKYFTHLLEQRAEGSLEGQAEASYWVHHSLVDHTEELGIYLEGDRVPLKDLSWRVVRFAFWKDHEELLGKLSILQSSSS